MYILILNNLFNIKQYFVEFACICCFLNIKGQIKHKMTFDSKGHFMITLYYFI